ncbi:MAG: adenylosuccinate lyase [Deltaproteobacteria bacterium]|nr:adenylosuccinate lyase [Deltaproteobacteria bacterium]
MIERYTLERMHKVWTDENRFKKWLEVEILICEAYAKLSIIPEDAVTRIKERARIDVNRIKEIEKRTKHDVVAFVESVSEFIGPDSKYFHMGVTSSDILDTSFSCLLKDACDIIINDVESLMSVLKEKAYEYKDTKMMGRTHGVHAEPITFGLKLANFYDEMRRNLERLRKAKEYLSYGKISGAVGTYAHVPPFVEEYVLKSLGLKVAPISSQIISRDYYADFFTTLAILASTVERMAVEVRHLQRTEVNEAEEFFEKGQTGSSAMPHKRNPIASENLSGLARLLRSYAIAALENIPLWHERDISHSSVERVIAPDATILIDYMLERAKNLYNKLVVYPENMRSNIEKTKGLYHSEGVLVALMKKGVDRTTAYAITQRVAMKCYENNLDFREEIKKDEDIRKHLGVEEIDKLVDDTKYFKYVDMIFNRVFR